MYMFILIFFRNKCFSSQIVYLLACYSWGDYVLLEGGTCVCVGGGGGGFSHPLLERGGGGGACVRGWLMSCDPSGK